MTSTMQKNGRTLQNSGNGNGKALQQSNKPKAPPTIRRNGAGSQAFAKPAALNPSRATGLNARSERSGKAIGTRVAKQKPTAIENCVQGELRRYFDMLDGEEPANLYRMVIRQAESALVNMVMEECRGNQTRASEWLGISRGNLRTKLANMDK